MVSDILYVILEAKVICKDAALMILILSYKEVNHHNPE
jgi:hypothetical protein